MKKTILAAVVAAASIAGTSSFAAVIGFTEGTRDHVQGTQQLAPKDTSPNPANAFDLDTAGTLGQDTFEIFGRIVDSVDNFAFGFSATSTFNVSWIFGGYNLESDGSLVNNSGFVSEGNANKKATFKLLDANNGNSVVQSIDFETDVTSGPAVIFTAGAGDYVIQIDGSGSVNAPGNGVGLYDIEISAVPLPASALFLLAGVAGLGAVARRKKG